MGKHVIFGAGPVGSALARLLVDRGESVRVVTRSGSGLAGTEPVAADASDADRVLAVTEGAEVIYNCVNPAYHRWATDWPPIASALLGAAERHGAVLATTSNLYGYGEVSAPMTEATPLAATGTKGRVRAAMWAEAVAAHEAGRVRAFEVRGSDYLGGSSLLGMMTPRLAKRATAWSPAPLDVLRTWTDVRDVAALLATGAGDERAWGRAWHVPSAEPLTLRQLTAVAAEQLGVPHRVREVPWPVLWTGGLVVPTLRELRETRHQFTRPFILDSDAAQQTFGLVPRSVTDSVAFDLAQHDVAREVQATAAG
ncbi:NAD-dependent epimerase/dehydratase family protein [Ornithinimicrobium sp. F0845]|uniref:NAD-dependent epimerase/dehydratase family protein n=1 Tax=Ornithinimicrobium sp. F0845 TaxID=2926412 RepID=UPI001FF50739|nr:NAD-dependent epimerase/dehydratase family protein [Ornithinimicrobium sp. F0845]MCK0113046.1 NAD-dependent epimerase/dehydratase family protein [Ornithinimicrobium sp. F0845]